MTITLRNLPPEVEEAITEKSKRDGLSLNKAATQLIAGTVRRRGRNPDFDKYLGLWTAEEAAEFDAALARQRQIEPEDWKP